MPRVTSHINVLMHALGYFSSSWYPGKRRIFWICLELYREAKIPLSVPIAVARSWIARFDNEYLASLRPTSALPVGARGDHRFGKRGRGQVTSKTSNQEPEPEQQATSDRVTGRDRGSYIDVIVLTT